MVNKGNIKNLEERLQETSAELKIILTKISTSEKVDKVLTEYMDAYVNYVAHGGTFFSKIPKERPGSLLYGLDRQRSANFESYGDFHLVLAKYWNALESRESLVERMGCIDRYISASAMARLDV